jgi:hypothetical protein
MPAAIFSFFLKKIHAASDLMTRSTRGTYTYMHTLLPPITIRRRRPVPMEPSCGSSSSSISCRLRVHTYIRRSTYCMHQQFGLVSGGWGPVEQHSTHALAARRGEGRNLARRKSRRQSLPAHRRRRRRRWGLFVCTHVRDGGPRPGVTHQKRSRRARQQLQVASISLRISF